MAAWQEAELDRSRLFTEVHSHPEGWRYLQDGVYFNVLGEPVAAQPKRPHNKVVEKARNIAQEQREKQLSAARKLANLKGFRVPKPVDENVAHENRRALAAESLSEDS